MYGSRETLPARDHERGVRGDGDAISLEGAGGSRHERARRALGQLERALLARMVRVGPRVAHPLVGGWLCELAAPVADGPWRSPTRPRRRAALALASAILTGHLEADAVVGAVVGDAASPLPRDPRYGGSLLAMEGLAGLLVYVQALRHPAGVPAVEAATFAWRQLVGARQAVESANDPTSRVAMAEASLGRLDTILAAGTVPLPVIDRAAVEAIALHDNPSVRVTAARVVALVDEPLVVAAPAPSAVEAVARRRTS